MKNLPSQHFLLLSSQAPAHLPPSAGDNSFYLSNIILLAGNNYFYLITNYGLVARKILRDFHSSVDLTKLEPVFPENFQKSSPFNPT